VKKLLKTNTFENTMIVALSIILGFTFLLPERKINKDLEPYYNTYVKQLDTFCPGKYKEPHQIVIDIKPLVGNNIGLCFKLFTKRYMYVDENHYEYSDDYKRKQVMYHEFSHCLLDKEHVADPNHYMYFEDNVILPHVFESQVIADMRTWCAE